MATRFEIVLHGADPASLRAAGEEALNEVGRLEEQLSLYRSGSEISHVNARAAREAVRVSPPVFKLLERARALSAETGGAFDVTIAPLVRCWGFMGGTGCVPDPGQVAAARELVGMELIELNRAEFTVRFAREGVMLDLGAIGKGYAIEKAVEILQDCGVSSALIHGGTSTVHAIGHPPDAEFWNVAIESGAARVSDSATNSKGSVNEGNRDSIETETNGEMITVPLRDEALSVSAISGKCFRSEGRTLGHVLDPRTGTPVTGVLLAAIVLPCATDADALSTALLVSGEKGWEEIRKRRPDVRALLIREGSDGSMIKSSDLGKQRR